MYNSILSPENKVWLKDTKTSGSANVQTKALNVFQGEIYFLERAGWLQYSFLILKPNYLTLNKVTIYTYFRQNYIIQNFISFIFSR